MNDKSFILKEICKTVQKARTENPLSPSITNDVTVNFVVNAQLAAGGRGVVVYLADEGEKIASMCKSAYINLGTMKECYAQTIPRTCSAFRKTENKWVFDPVGLGIGSLRTELFKMMKDFKPAVIRGNASEIIGLASLWDLCPAENSGVSGVDSTEEVLSARNAAVALAEYTGGAVAVSGETDLVSNGKTVLLCSGGSSFLPKITGAGCSLGGVMSVYANVAPPFYAALAGTVVYNVAAQKAEKKSKGSGSFMQNFLDCLFNIKEKDILKAKIEEI